jgi:[glutamine synthetase] adenylyltransferase / [glutamine synthetase]-adenylyl-L-tyrosine phosphorylase
LSNFHPPILPDALKSDARQKWDAVVAAATDADIPLPDNDPHVSDIQTVFALSDFVAKACARNPVLLADLLDSGDLERPCESDEYRQRVESALSAATGESDLSIALRRLRKREMVRIAWRDLSGRADLAETMAELSSFADACIDGALSRLHGWLEGLYGRPLGSDGTPLELVVIGMGKLGARELNFSSDVDLIFAFPETGDTEGEKSIPSTDFFLRLGRKLIKALGENTAEGFVFRVDMDLRPFGGNGPLVMSFDALESYYGEQGREWERYAWIKGRPAAGDIPAGERLLARLNPFIYRRYLDYGVFESLREMKAGIAREVKRRDLRDDIKLGAGGIREIEFFGQVFQLIRGGVSRPLQSRPIGTVLDRLAREGTIETAVRDELQAAYVFLRRTENRLQEFSDAQTHKLPPDEPARARLAASMGFADYKTFKTTLDMHMSAVRRHFGALLEPDGAGTSEEGGEGRRGTDLERVWQSPEDGDRAAAFLSAAGYPDPEAALKPIRHLRESTATAALSREGRDRLDRLIPQILKAAASADGPALALSRILELIRTVQQRTSYLALLLENPSALSHLVRFATTSAWILTFITRHPVLLDELLDTRTLYRPPDRSELESEIRERLDPIPPDDLEYQMDALRIFKQVNALRVAAADVTDALPLMRVSDHLSDIAETILDRSLSISRRHLTEKHGEPVCGLPDGETCREGFAVIAYGKLGGLELGYGSDLDMVFLHAGASEPTRGGDRPTDSGYFFSRLGQRLIHMLTARTPAGTLYEADMRLRPSGASGVLVSHVESFGQYQENEAWTWEQQALIRARPVCGDPAVADRFEAIRRRVLARERDEAGLRRSVADMRDRLRKESLKGNAGGFDLKHGEGGMVDIEFLVQYLVLRHAREYDELVRWTDNVRLIGALCRCGVFDDATAYFLRKAYLTYRIVGHRLDLKEQPAIVSDDRFRTLRRIVKRNWDRFLGARPGRNPFDKPRRADV